MSYDPYHEHTFTRRDEVTLECTGCGTHWAPRIRLTEHSSAALLEAIDHYLQVLRVARQNAKAFEESPTEYNHKMGQLKRVRTQTLETRERFGWPATVGSTSVR